MSGQLIIFFKGLTICSQRRHIRVRPLYYIFLYKNQQLQKCEKLVVLVFIKKCCSLLDVFRVPLRVPKRCFVQSDYAGVDI